MKTSTRAFLVGGLIVAAVGGVTYLNRSRGAGDDRVKAVQSSKQPVRAVVTRKEDLFETIRQTGTLAAARDVVLTAEVTGKVRRKLKALGASCRQGEAIVQLDPESYQIARLQAEAGLRQARAQLQQARREHERSAALVKRATVAAQVAEQAETAAQAAEAAVKQAEAAAQLASRNLRETLVRCPFPGVVAEVMVELGQMVSPQTPIARLVDTRVLKLRLNVSAAEHGRLRVGHKVQLVDAAMPTAAAVGTVARLGVAGDPQTHSFPLEVELPGDAGLAAGQVVRAAVQIAEHRGAIAVPEEAIVGETESASPTVFVARQGRARRLTVSLGPRVERKVIVTGLAAGEAVILMAGRSLKDGDPVEVITGGSPEAGAASGSGR